MERRVVYLDNNATTPVRREVLDAMLPFLTDEYGNASSLHAKGRFARDAVERARESVARLIGASASDIVFTSGGTESVNSAIRGGVDRVAAERRRLVVSAVEHHAVSATAEALERRGFQLTTLPVDGSGWVHPDAVQDFVDESVALVSVMHGNNEVGTIQPISDIASRVRETGALVHTDAVQSVGKIPVSVAELGVDLLSLSGHKIGAPKGVGALYARRGIPWDPLILGGAQERRRRGGTENVPAIVGLGVAADLARAELRDEAARLRRVTERFVTELCERIEGVSVNSPETRLPGTVNLSFDGANGESLVMALDLEGVCVSTGSACASGSTEPSRALAAMGFPKERITASVRFSFGFANTEDDVDFAVSALERALSRFRRDANRRVSA